MNKLKYYIKRIKSLNYKKAVETLNKISKRSRKPKIILFFDMLFCSFKYMSGYVDYDLFGFENLSNKQRKTFITRGVNTEYIKALNNRNFYYKLDNKIEFNKIFKDFVKRDFLDLNKDDLKTFKNFVSLHSTFIAKPVDKSGGEGIEKIEVNNSTNLEELYNRLKLEKKYLLEEFVIQSKFMNDIFPKSVNTLRFVTIRKDNKTTIVHRVIRIGNGNNVVDNFHNGGMYSVVNEYGIVEKPAIDRNGNIYSKHPVTGHIIEGLVIENFKEIEKFIIKASETIPEVGYVGWDIALTEKGPIMIEGNNLPGYDLYQSKIHLNDNGTGMKPKFDSVIYGNKYKRNNKFYFFIALIACKITKKLLKLRKKEIPYYPGTIAMKICPNYLYYLSKPKQIISVTGTNGKSTICKMLIDFFKSQNISTINNNGFNTVVGVASFLTDAVSISNKCNKDIAIIETDELTSKKIYENICPDYIIISNLFRDSIKKNANTEYIRDILKESIPKDSKLIINGDDLLCTTLSNKNTVYFGMAKTNSDLDKCNNIVCDAVICPKCNKKVTYELIRYHHIGKFVCEHCGYKSPKCKYEITKINDEEKYFILNNEIYNFLYPNIPNMYNALSVISLLKEMGFNFKTIAESFKNIELLETRFFKEVIKNKEVISIMAKGQNPIAVSQALDLIEKDKDLKDIIIILDDVNDRKNSCEIISWIYDSDFEFLKNETINKIIIGGKRNKDYLLRLLIAGINKDKIITVENEIDTPDYLDVKNNNKIYLMHDIFAHFTATQIRNKIHNKIEGEL